MKIRTTISVIALAVAIYPTPLSAETVIPTVGDLYRAFETVVFGSEFGNKKPRSKVLKWEQPMRVAIRAYDDVITDHGNAVTEIGLEQIPVRDAHFEIAKKHLETLSRLVNLKMEDYKNSEKEPNLTINFVSKIHMSNPVLVNHENVNVRHLAAQNGCYFVIWKNAQTGAIDRAIIVANIDRDAQGLSHCVLEELTQSLGLPNDNNVNWPSIFSNNQRVTKLSHGDRIILKALYDPQIKSGMDKKKVMRRVLKIINALDRQKPKISE